MENKLRRRDKEILDQAVIREILQKGKLCHLAMVDGGKPYILTMNYGYSNEILYFHTAKEGRKMDILRDEPEVCFQVVTDTRLITGENACGDWTMQYRSVVGYGNASLVNDTEDKIKALNIMMDQYTTKGPFEFPRKNLDETAVIKVEITSLSGKKSVN